MKQIRIFTMLTACCALLFGACMSSCQKDKSSDSKTSKIPDAAFKATVTGALSQNIEFTMPEGKADKAVVNGSFNSTLGLFRINAIDATTWQLGFGASMTEVKPGTYSMNQTNMGDNGGFTNTSLSMSSFSSVSGSITISKAELYQGVGTTLGAANDWYVDGSFEMTLVDNSTPVNTIMISGTFSGINIKAN